MKKIIKLSESDLHNIIKESARKIMMNETAKRKLRSDEKSYTVPDMFDSDFDDVTITRKKKVSKGQREANAKANKEEKAKQKKIKQDKDFDEKWAKKGYKQGDLFSESIHKAIKRAINELSYETLFNAAKKRKGQGEYNKAEELESHGVNAFNRDYGVHDDEYGDTNSGGRYEKHAAFGMANGAGNGRKGDLRIKSYDKGVPSEFSQYVDRVYNGGLSSQGNGCYKHPVDKGHWGYQNGMTDDEMNSKVQPTWSPKVANAMKRGVESLDNYVSGKSQYKNGKWDV